MADITAEVPHLWLLVAVTVAVLGAEVAIFAFSEARLGRQETARRLALGGDWQAADGLIPPSRLLEIIATLLPGVVVVVFARVIQNARDSLVAAMTPAIAMAGKALRASQSLSAEANATPFAFWAVGAAFACGSLAVAAAVSARQRACGLQQAARLATVEPKEAAAWLAFPGPEMTHLLAGIGVFLLLGFGPIARGGFVSTIDKIRAFAKVATLAPDDKGAFFSRALDEATRRLTMHFGLACLGVLTATVIAAIFAWRFSPARARARLLGGTTFASGPGSKAGVIIAVSVIVLAIGAGAATQRLRAESHLPWPPYEGGERLMAVIATPDLDGPDEMERLPVIHVTPDAMGLDGREGDAEAIAGQLDSLRRNYSMLQPDRPFSGQVLVVCQADTRTDRLSEVLRAAINGGMPHATFVFLRRQVVDRPLLGHHWRNRARAARTTAVESKADFGSTATILQVDQFPTCNAISQKIVAARLAGHEVALLLAPHR